MQRTKPETGTDECELHQETFNSNLTEFHLDIGNLLPYTQYTVLVAAVTSCEGPLEPGINTTDEDGNLSLYKMFYVGRYGFK